MSKINVLCVDEDRVLLESISHALKDDYRVFTAQDPSGGLNQAFNGQLDILITGLGMPMQAGVDFFDYMKANHEDLPVIVISDCDDLSLITRYIAQGAYDYIPKPFPIENLKKSVDNALIYKSSVPFRRRAKYREGQGYRWWNYRGVLRGADDAQILSLINAYSTDHALSDLNACLEVHLSTERANILVVDDERGPRESIRMVMKYDHEIFLADRVKGGLELLEKHPIDLLITGIRMPEMSGIEFLEIVQKQYPMLPVLVLTGGCYTLNCALRAIQLGAFDYLPKPFDINELMIATRHALAYGTYLESKDSNKVSDQCKAALLNRWRVFKKELLSVDGMQLQDKLSRTSREEMLDPASDIWGKDRLLNIVLDAAFLRLASPEDPDPNHPASKLGDVWIGGFQVY